MIINTSFIIDSTRTIVLSNLQLEGFPEPCREVRCPGMAHDATRTPQAATKHLHLCPHDVLQYHGQIYLIQIRMNGKSSTSSNRKLMVVNFDDDG